MEVGQQVKFTDPLDADEAAQRFVVVELRGPRVLVEYICEMNIKPQMAFLASDMVCA